MTLFRLIQQLNHPHRSYQFNLKPICLLAIFWLSTSQYHRMNIQMLMLNAHQSITQSQHTETGYVPLIHFNRHTKNDRRKRLEFLSENKRSHKYGIIRIYVN